MFNPKRFAAGTLRGVANQLDPEPPHMETALRLLGWHYDGNHWTYQAGLSTEPGATTAAPPGVVRYHWPEELR